MHARASRARGMADPGMYRLPAALKHGQGLEAPRSKSRFCARNSGFAREASRARGMADPGMYRLPAALKRGQGLEGPRSKSRFCARNSGFAREVERRAAAYSQMLAEKFLCSNLFRRPVRYTTSTTLSKGAG